MEICSFRHVPHKGEAAQQPRSVIKVLLCFCFFIIFLIILVFPLVCFRLLGVVILVWNSGIVSSSPVFGFR